MPFERDSEKTQQEGDRSQTGEASVIPPPRNYSLTVESIEAFLADPRADPNAISACKMLHPPLLRAAIAAAGALDVMKVLLATPARDVRGCTPLWHAAEKGPLAVVEALLAHPNIDVNVLDIDRRSVPMAAAMSTSHPSEEAKSAVFAALLADVRLDTRRLIALPDTVHSTGCTPLIAAAECGSYSCVDMILKKAKEIFADGDSLQSFFNVNAVGGGRFCTAAHHAVHHPHILRLLLDFPTIDVTVPTIFGFTPLVSAALCNSVASIEAIVSNPPSTRADNNSNNKIKKRFAAKYTREGMAKDLGAALRCAASASHVESVRVLLAIPSSAIDVNAVGEQNDGSICGVTALGAAAMGQMASTANGGRMNVPHPARTHRDCENARRRCAVGCRFDERGYFEAR